MSVLIDVCKCNPPLHPTPSKNLYFKCVEQDDEILQSTLYNSTNVMRTVLQNLVA